MELHYLSLVEVAAIPLHLAIGPSLDVWSDNLLTRQWFSECLLETGEAEGDTPQVMPPWWLRPIQQSDHGILLGVEYGAGENQSSSAIITEILIYAALSRRTKYNEPLPTPPGSSPRADEGNCVQTSSKSAREIRLYALPLSSRNTPQAQHFAGLQPPSLSKFLTSGEARFYPSVTEDILATPTSPRKRQKVSTMFEDARHQRKRLLRHGGETISRAMAGIDNVALYREPSLQFLSASEKERLSTNRAEEPTQSEASVGALSRASSTTSLHGTESSRPPSRIDALMKSKRTSLHRVESIAVTSRNSPALESNTTEVQNKSALSRVVMTGMRIHGLQQRKKTSKDRQDVDANSDRLGEPSCAPEDEDEYKLIYHQTFKAASFTFRSRVTVEIINQQAMRDVVDRLLVMFCNDPLASGPTNEGFFNKESYNEGASENHCDSINTDLNFPNATGPSFGPGTTRRLPGLLAKEKSMCMLPSTVGKDALDG